MAKNQEAEKEHVSTGRLVSNSCLLNSCNGKKISEKNAEMNEP